MTRPEERTLRELLQLAMDAARAAGAITRRYFGTQPTVQCKSPGNPVTAADTEADACLRHMLLSTCSQYGWLSEETEDAPERSNRERVWIVDPLDGTSEFLRGIPEYAVSIALVERKEPVLGVVYNPVRDELFAAVRRGGAFLNGQRTFCAQAADLEHASLLVSPRSIQHGDLAELRPHLGSIKPTGSIAYRLALVAAGQADITATPRPKNEWDVCAGDLLIREAGGTMRDWKGNQPTYNRPDPLIPHGLAAGNTPLVERLLALWGRRDPDGSIG